MKRTILLSLLISLTVICQGQNQIQLYIQQIAANKIYIEYLQKGYDIVKNGLNTIGNIKNGHYSLDKDFFSQLENVNPKVRHYAKAADIIALNIQVIKRYKKALMDAEANDVFDSSELDYITKVFNAVVDNCSSLTNELTTLLKPFEWKMSDDERLKRIDGIHTTMSNNYVFVNHFAGELQILSIQKGKEFRDATMLHDLYGK